MSQQDKIPEFYTEAEERVFWESHDSTRYVDWNNAQEASFPNLKPSTKTISLRLPEGLLERIKIEANKRDMPYQSLIKAWLAGDVKHGRHPWQRTTRKRLRFAATATMRELTPESRELTPESRPQNPCQNPHARTDPRIPRIPIRIGGREPWRSKTIDSRFRGNDVSLVFPSFLTKL